MQTGYLARRDPVGQTVTDEMIALPIHSTETGAVIAAFVLGFNPVEANGGGTAIGMKSGIFVAGKVQLAGLDRAAEAEVSREVQRDLLVGRGEEHSLRVQIDCQPHLLFFKRLNPRSNSPPAYDVCVYPLEQLLPASADCVPRFSVEALARPPDIARLRAYPAQAAIQSARGDFITASRKHVCRPITVLF